MNRVTGTIRADPDDSGPLHHLAVRNSYDAAGRLTKVETGELVPWQSEAVAPSAWIGFTVFRLVEIGYDAMDRKTVEKLSGIENNAPVAKTLTQYSYDAAGRLECTAVRMNPAAFGSLPASACTLGTMSTYGPDRITRQVYDAAGQVLQVQKAVGTALQQDYATFTYSANGKQLSMTDANGNKATMVYDGFDRQTEWHFPDKTAIGAASANDYEAYGYDAGGNRTALRKRDGRRIGYTYDALNRVTLKSFPDGGATAVHYGYDLRGLQTYARFGSPSGAGITSDYDRLGRLRSSTSTMSGTSLTLQYEYDADGNRTRITHPDGTYFAYNYDGLDQVSSIYQNGTAGIMGFGYDSQSRLQHLYPINVGSSLLYDPVSRLSHIDYFFTGTNDGVTLTYAHNPANQIVTMTRDNSLFSFNGYVSVSRNYATNGLNQYLFAGPATFDYDDNGNLTSDGMRTYGYDIENRLVSTGSGVALDYDPTGRLWRVRTPSRETQFLYDGSALVAEYDGSGNRTHTYVHAPGEDRPLVWYKGSTVGYSNLRTTLPDHQGSIIAAINLYGVPQFINTYDEYGIPGTGNDGRFQYTGQVWLAELGMYYYKARIYSPTLGRFLQTDPIGYDDQNNLYAYVANDPVNKTDPTGTQERLDMQMRQDDEALLNHTMSEQEYRDRQNARGMGGLIGAGIVGAVVAAPEVISAVSARVGFTTARGALAAAERGGEVAVRRTAQGAMTTIRNIITNNGKFSDFLGAARESRGVQTGFDHVTEMKNSVTGLEGASRSLGGSLRNPNLSSEVRGALQSWKNAADTAIKQMKRILE